ncbi:MAG TPA: NAD(P)H-binding protein, partial [Pyrinomonadaceae bacterium]|nr:NAD(P)H-binding protein [Pyrinomonadaceae bacterium]
MKKVLVAGATGHLGRAVIKELRARRHWVRALVRDARRLGDARDLVDDLVAGDFATTDFYGRAAEGIEVVISC